MVLYNICSAHLLPGRPDDYLDMEVSWYRRIVAVGPSS